MAQHLATDQSRRGIGLAALDGVAKHGVGNREGNGITNDYRSAAVGVRTNKARGSSADFAQALRQLFGRGTGTAVVPVFPTVFRVSEKFFDGALVLTF